MSRLAPSTACLLLLTAVCFACSDDARGDDELGESSSFGTSSGSSDSGSSDSGSSSSSSTTGPTDSSSDSDGSSSADTGIKFDMQPPPDAGGGDCFTCSADLEEVLDCQGNLVETCTGTLGCDAATGTCIDACQAAENNQAAIGCEYYPTFTRVLQGVGSRCYAAYVANIWSEPAHIEVFLAGQELAIESFARLPNGAGPNLSYAPYDAGAGLPPGEVLILFLGDASGNTCPVPSATGTSVQLTGTGIGEAFQVLSDVPVVAYQMNPYGGGSAAATGASLLLPTSVWDSNYVLVNAQEFAIGQPTANLIAAEDDTTISILPVAAIQGGGGVPATPADQVVDIVLDAGQHIQLLQNAELTGSIVQSDKPIGLIAGNTAMQAPVGTAYADHGEQMIPPIRALGHEYAAVMHRPRASEPSIWRVIGAVDGTTLSYSSEVGGPASIDQGQRVDFITGDAFVIESQDADHPFMLFNLMAGSQWANQPGLNGRGDADFVISVPPAQYLRNYVFFADPTYPTTNLVLIRRRTGGQFHDVTLDCAGILGGWTALGSDYEWTRFDLIDGDFVDNGMCSTGGHQISSDGYFGLWVWGWGTPDTGIFTANVSYGYPGGMNVAPINEVVIPPVG